LYEPHIVDDMIYISRFNADKNVLRTVTRTTFNIFKDEFKCIKTEMDLNRIMEYKYFTNRIAKIEIIDHQKFIG